MAKKKAQVLPIFVSVSLEESGQREGALDPTLSCMSYIQVSSATLKTRGTIWSHWTV